MTDPVPCSWNTSEAETVWQSVKLCLLSTSVLGASVAQVYYSFFPHRLLHLQGKRPGRHSYWISSVLKYISSSGFSVSEIQVSLNLGIYI